MGINQRSVVQMTPSEIDDFIKSQRTATLVTLGPTGHPHAVAMWFAIVDDEIWFETKEKAQKALNVRRDERATVLIEDGETYDQLRGVSLEGLATVVEDPEMLWRVGVSVHERYFGPYSEDVRPVVEKQLRKRVAIRFQVTRARSWDHRKLNLDPAELSGTTGAP